MTFKLKNLGEHDLLPNEHWNEYLYTHGVFIRKFWDKWKREYEINKGDADLLRVICDDFIEQGGQPVPPAFWNWLRWDLHTEILKALYPEETIPKAIMAQFPVLQGNKK